MLGPAIVAPEIRWRADQIVWAPVLSDSRLLRFIDPQNDVTKMSLRWDEEKKDPPKYAHILLPDKFTITFYPRPVLAFGYCCSLRLSVCVSVNYQVVVRVNGDNSSSVQVGIAKFR